MCFVPAATASPNGGMAAPPTASRCTPRRWRAARFRADNRLYSEPAWFYRVMRASGWLRAFDGDYGTATVALADHEPLQICVDAMVANSVNDRRLVRRLPVLVRNAGFEQMRFTSHGFAETEGGAYAVDRRPRRRSALRIRQHRKGDRRRGSAPPSRGGDVFRAYRLRQCCGAEARNEKARQITTFANFSCRVPRELLPPWPKLGLQMAACGLSAEGSLSDSREG